jgi:hypothetical protein
LSKNADAHNRRQSSPGSNLKPPSTGARESSMMVGVKIMNAVFASEAKQ